MMLATMVPGNTARASFAHSRAAVIARPSAFALSLNTSVRCFNLCWHKPTASKDVRVVVDAGEREALAAKVRQLCGGRIVLPQLQQIGLVDVLEVLVSK